MKVIRNLTAIVLTFALASLLACGGGGGGQKTVSGTIVNEAGSTLSAGKYTIVGSGTVGSIGGAGTFAAATATEAGQILLTSSSSGFRVKRVGFDLTETSHVDLGNVTLPNDSLSNGWGSYRAGNLADSETKFKEHIAASGRDLPDAENGLGWVLVRAGKQDEAFNHFFAALGAGFDAEPRTGLAAAYLGRTVAGTDSLGEAISNLDIAIGVNGTYLSRPLHDDISEDDLVALRGMLNLLDGRIPAATADRNLVLGKEDADLNAASEDLLLVLDFLLGT